VDRALAADKLAVGLHFAAAAVVEELELRPAAELVLENLQGCFEARSDREVVVLVVVAAAAVLAMVSVPSLFVIATLRAADFEHLRGAASWVSELDTADSGPMAEKLVAFVDASAFAVAEKESVDCLA
jgi:hypothetical protein